jgi:hypothetical protein
MKLQLERGSIATPYEPHIESTAYVVAKDEEGNIAELRSLPNGTKDEVSLSEKKSIKRTNSFVLNSEYIAAYSTAKTNVDLVVLQLPSDSANINLGASGGKIYIPNIPLGGSTHSVVDDVAFIGMWAGYASEARRICIVVPKGKYTGIEDAKAKFLNDYSITELTYQLATPIEIPIQTSGSLVSYPSGTVYIEPYVADAGIYTDKMEVLYSDLPIKALEKISKVDFATGLEIELDITAALIAEDKLSFTHPNLTSGDIVFFTYEYDRESTEGETEIEYYDSRYVIIDSVTGKIYKWQITVANGVPSIELTEV